jgi:hypothetical protein
MKKPLNLSNSIYQQRGAGYGLNVNAGMLINNRMNSTTGIQKAVELKKTIKRAEKISTMSEAVALGSMKEDMMGGDCCM